MIDSAAIGFEFDADGHAYRILHYSPNWPKSTYPSTDPWQSDGSTITWTTDNMRAYGSGHVVNGKLQLTFGWGSGPSDPYKGAISRDSCSKMPNPLNTAKAETEGRRWEIQNNYPHAITFELRDGSTGTGQSCESNERIDSKTLEHGESATYACRSYVGFCVRWKNANANTDQDYTAWSGVACDGSNPIWTRFHNLRIKDF